MISLADRINVLVQRHGSLKKVSDEIGIEQGRLCRLRLTNTIKPTNKVLKRLGLKQVGDMYELLDNNVYKRPINQDLIND